MLLVLLGHCILLKEEEGGIQNWTAREPKGHSSVLSNRTLNIGYPIKFGFPTLNKIFDVS